MRGVGEWNQLIEVDIDYLYYTAGRVVMVLKCIAGRRKKVVGIFPNGRVAVIQSCVRAIYKSCHCRLYEIKQAVL